MSIGLGGGKSVLAIPLIDITSGQERILFHRPRRKCYFVEDIVHSPYIIALRIDWGDLQDGGPTMDADVYHKVNGERGQTLKDKKRSGIIPQYRLMTAVAMTLSSRISGCD